MMKNVTQATILNKNFQEFCGMIFCLFPLRKEMGDKMPYRPNCCYHKGLSYAKIALNGNDYCLMKLNFDFFPIPSFNRKSTAYDGKKTPSI